MWPVLIVVLLHRELLFWRSPVSRRAFVKAFVPKAAVEAFDKSILCRLARGNVVPANAGLLLPFEYRYRGQLGSVVGHDRGRFAAPADDDIQLPALPGRRTERCRQPTQDIRG